MQDIGRRRTGRRRVGQRAGRASPPGTGTTWCCGRSIARRPMRWPAIAPARARSPSFRLPAGGRGVERHRRRRRRPRHAGASRFRRRSSRPRCARRRRRTTAGGAAPMVVCASKGLEPGTGATMATVIAANLPGARVGVLSGPSFAEPRSRAGCPAALVVASNDADAAARRAGLLRRRSPADLHQRRRHRRVPGRRAQERHRHRRRLLRRLRLRRQRARRADHARPRRDGPARGADGRPGAHAGRAGGARRSGADLHRRSVAQPAGRAGARARRRARRTSSAGSATSRRASAPRASRAIWRRGSASTCRSRARSPPCFTTASRRARRSNDLLARDIGAER